MIPSQKSPNKDNPHAEQPVYTAGASHDDADLFCILLHGRGAHPRDMIRLANNLRRKNVRYLAPRANHHTWYPYRFIAPIKQNEPELSSALQRVDTIIEELEADGITSDRIILAGFSQGGCVALDYAARNARHYAGIAGFSAGLIGQELDTSVYEGHFKETPVFLGCSEEDPHIPSERFKETSEIFKKMGADVDARLYPHLGHAINEDEIEALRNLTRQLVT